MGLFVFILLIVFVIGFIVLLHKYLRLKHKFINYVEQKADKSEEEERLNFVTSVVHDLKTPTLAQIQALNLLLKNTFGELQAKQIAIIEEIRNSCDYMYSLILTILNTYLYENGQIKLQLSEFNFNELFNEVTKDLISLLEEKNLKLIINSEISDKLIIADRLQIKRVLVNLISNAVTYSDNGTEITLTVKIKNEKLECDVQNISNYIDEDFIKSVYQKFQSTSEYTFRKTGTGLGLYIVKQIISAHSGNVYAKSSKNGVCNFGFSLPLKMNVNVDEKTFSAQCGDF